MSHANMSCELIVFLMLSEAHVTHIKTMQSPSPSASPSNHLLFDPVQHHLLGIVVRFIQGVLTASWQHHPFFWVAFYARPLQTHVGHRKLWNNRSKFEKKNEKLQWPHRIYNRSGSLGAITPSKLERSIWTSQVPSKKSQKSRESRQRPASLYVNMKMMSLHQTHKTYLLYFEWSPPWHHIMTYLSQILTFFVLKSGEDGEESIILRKSKPNICTFFESWFPGAKLI